MVARTSAFKFKGQADDIRRIGEQLDVATVLEGSVRKAGNRLRITAQLISVSDGYHLWSERYDRTLDDVFAVQEEIAQAIVGKLRVELVGAPDAALVKVSTTNLEAYNLLLEGRHHMNRLSAAGFGRAIECFERAVAIEPDYAPAYAGLASVLGGQSFLSMAAPRDCMPKAREAAERALAADPECAEAISELAEVRSWYDWDFVGAEREYRRALDLGPGSAVVHCEYGLFLAARGRPDEAIAEARRGLELDPLSLIGGFYLAFILYYAARLDEAETQCRKTLTLEPHGFPVRRTLAMVLSATDHPEGAVSALEASREDADGDPMTEALLGQAYARASRREEAQAILDALKLRRGAGYLSAVCIAWVYTGLDEVDTAMEWFEQGYRDRDTMCGVLAAHRLVAGERDRAVYDDPRYLNLLRRIEEGGKQ